MKGAGRDDVALAVNLFGVSIRERSDWRQHAMPGTRCGRVRDHLHEAPPCTPGRGGVHSIYEACMSDDMRAVLFGGAALLLFLLLFAFGQFQEIFRATGYH